MYVVVLYDLLFSRCVSATIFIASIAAFTSCTLSIAAPLRRAIVCNAVVAFSAYWGVISSGL